MGKKKCYVVMFFDNSLLLDNQYSHHVYSNERDAINNLFNKLVNNHVYIDINKMCQNIKKAWNDEKEKDKNVIDLSNIKCVFSNGNSPLEFVLDDFNKEDTPIDLDDEDTYFDLMEFVVLKLRDYISGDISKLNEVCRYTSSSYGSTWRFMIEKVRMDSEYVFSLDIN